MIVLTGASGGIGSEISEPLRSINIGNNSIIKVHNKHPVEFGSEVDLSVLRRGWGSIESLGKEVRCFTAPLNITLIHLAAVKIDELAVFVNEENWDKVFNVNLKGAFFLTKELLPIMMREKWGRIIFVLSSGLGDVGTLSYSASKYGLIGLSEVLSREYARYGITSNILQLGYFQTGMWNKLSEPKKDELLNQIPDKKLGNTKDIVNAISFLMTTPTVNGAVISVDGGI